jgi:hypothetical protein
VVAAAAVLDAVFGDVGEALVGGVPGVFGGGVLAPGVLACAAALSVAFQQRGHDGVSVFGGGAFGLGVHGAGSVVVGQDHAEVVGGGVFGAAAQLVDVAVVEHVAVFVVGFAGLTGVRV